MLRPREQIHRLYLLCIGEIKFVHVDIYLDMLLRIKFGQQTYRLAMA